MPNTIYGNTYLILDTSATALAWPTAGARIKTLVIRAANTSSAVHFNIGGVGTPIFMWNLAIHGVGSSAQVFPSTYSYDFGGVRFQTAWIPSTLTAASCWIHFV